MRQRFEPPDERPFRLAQGLAALHLGLGRDQVGDALDLREVELVVVERAAGELAGLGQAQSLLH